MSPKTVGEILHAAVVRRVARENARVMLKELGERIDAHAKAKGYTKGNTPDEFWILTMLVVAVEELEKSLPEKDHVRT